MLLLLILWFLKLTFHGISVFAVSVITFLDVVDLIAQRLLVQVKGGSVGVTDM